MAYRDPAMGLPPKVATARNYLIVLGLFKSVPTIMVLYMLTVAGDLIPDPVGWKLLLVAAIILPVVCGAFFIAAYQLHKGNPRCMVFAWCGLPISLLGFPFLTILSIMTIVALQSSEVTEYLRQKRPQGFPVLPDEVTR